MNATAEMAHSAANDGDTAWVLASSAMVLLMTPGLAFFYGGLVRDTSIINTMMMSIIAMGIISIIWALVGFSLAFGEDNPFIGNFKHALFMGLDGGTWGESTVWALAFAVFQMTFAIISAAILSGSLVERVRFKAYVLLIALWSLLVYVPLCHWVWGPGGWMEEWGALDFAGGTVVHISSGTSGLVAAVILGPRRHEREGDKPNNVPFVLLGAALLWFGWSGFNGGSALAADSTAARALTATYLAASASMLSWVGIESVRLKQPSSVGAMVGAVGGLVVITPAAGFVSPIGAIIMGAVGAPVCYASVLALSKFEKVDDTLDAFGLHGVGGLTGAIMTGLFAVEDGLFYGGGGALFGKQIVCALVGAAYSAAVTALIFGALCLVMRVRVHDHQEADGLDEHVHGEQAYSPSKDYVAGKPKRSFDGASMGDDANGANVEV
uniref:Ammonium transporter n=1 Tax=Alexandrium andersonii TaxID=327968 RepID=A0A7S2EZ80_9DINO|mmetsp:Transcript_101021/g.226513  ORF Transcript_101021/g.226513 Transcript_101021/m.226513 type:complete len:438 (+) Transcript_101021:128-1441(+)